MSEKALAAALLDWFRKNARSLPFRQGRDPYHIWVSEIMLQQTRVGAALEHYRRFVAALPTPAALAVCPDEELFKLWEGLGYYSRARNLKKAAQLVCRRWGGALPADYEALKSLPGVGEYTAGAIASIAFGLPVAAVDGNVLRVVSRLVNSSEDIGLPAAKRRVARQVLAWQPKDDPGRFNEALMELGALVCVPGAPRCEGCPLAGLCRARAAGTQNELPVKTGKKPRRLQPVTAFLVRGPRGWLLQKRPEKGLLAGLWQPLLFEGQLTLAQGLAALAGMGLAPDPAAPPQPLPAAKHIFTHVEWRLGGWQLEVADAPAPPGCVWASGEEAAGRYALPGAFKAWRGLLTGEQGQI